MSVEEYLAMDRDAEVKSEYHDGEVFELEGATLAHGRIGVNMARRLDERLEGTPCLVLNPLRVQISATKFVYPDLVVVCGKPVLASKRSENLTNPKVIVEILSPSTDGYNYGRKFSLYGTLASFEEYVLIAQDEPRVDVFRRGEGNHWILGRYSGLESVAKLESLGIELPLAEIYKAVEFEVLEP